MLFSDILGLTHIKNHLTTTVDRGRIPHAQLFVGSHGRGTLPMAIAYAQYILCQNKDGENRNDHSCNNMCNALSHPDLHFSFPVNTNKRITKSAQALDFIDEWRTFVAQKSYGSIFDWYQALSIERKQGKIGIEDAKNIAHTLSLKSYEGGFKVMIIWHAETMNIRAANYLLKLIEEPPKKTAFILITEDEGQILQTIRSRCQPLHFPPLGEKDIQTALKARHHCSENEAQKIAFQADGSYANALRILHGNKDEELFEKWFIDWVRTAFLARGNKNSILNLISWAETVAKTGRETQKRFLIYCLDFMRQALLKNYKADNLVYLTPTTKNFQLEKFAPFIHGRNILDISEELENAIYHIERNGNSRLILTDLSIKLTRLLHRKKR